MVKKKLLNYFMHHIIVDEINTCIAAWMIFIAFIKFVNLPNDCNSTSYKLTHRYIAVSKNFSVV